MSRVFINGPADQGTVPGRVIPKNQKMVLDTALLNTQYYKVRIKVKVEQSMECSSALPNTSIFVSASHRRGLDTKSMTQRSIIVEI